MLASLLVVVAFSGVQLDAVEIHQGVFSPEGEQARLEVTFTGLRSEDGRVRAALFDSSRGFPTQWTRHALERGEAAIEGNQATLVFDDLPPGEYAVVCYHDENDNGVMDTTLIKSPLEGAGASNDARGFMGLPGFRDAAVTVDGEPKRIEILVEYPR